MALIMRSISAGLMPPCVREMGGALSKLPELYITSTGRLIGQID